MAGSRGSDGTPGRRSQPARTAAWLGAAVVAVGAATALLVARGPGEVARGPRTVSVVVTADHGGSWRPHFPTPEERASIAAHFLGEAIDGRGGLVWLPNLGVAPAADVEITGTMRARLVGLAVDSLTITLLVPRPERTDTIRQTVFAGGPDPGVASEQYSGIARRVLASLGAPQSDRSASFPQTGRPALAACCAWPTLVGLHGEPPSPGVVEKLLDDRADLAIVERALLAAAAVRDLPARLDSLEALAARFPSYYPALWIYADALAHYGALAGRSADEGIDALSAVLAVRPKGGLAGLRTHLANLTALMEAPARRPPYGAPDAPRLAARGAWDEAYAASGSAVAASVADRLYAYRLAAIGHWMGGLPAEAPERRRGALFDADLAQSELAEFAWLDGLVASVAGDGAAMDAARLRVRGSGAPNATDLERSLRAFQLAAAEDEEMRAARLLRSLEEERASRLGFGAIENDAHPFLTGVNRLAAAQWFIRHGRSSYALPLLGWWERLPVGAPAIAEADAVLSPLDFLQRARAYREAGDPEAAYRYFSRFLDAFDRASPRLRGWVRDAEAAREALRGSEGGRGG